MIYSSTTKYRDSASRRLQDARGYLGSGPPSVTYVRLTEALLTNLPFDPDNTPLQKTEFIGIIVCCC